MSEYPTTYRDLTGNAAVEAIELRECCGLGSTGFADEQPLGSTVTWDDVDAMWAEEMARRDAAAREVFGGGDDNSDPTPPAAGALRPDQPEYWRAVAARMADDRIVAAVGAADDDPHTMALTVPAEREAFLSGFTAELLQRLSVRKAA